MKQPIDYEEECSLPKLCITIIAILFLLGLALSDAFAGGTV